MKGQLTAVAVLAFVLMAWLAPPAMAGPWITADGDLTEWGIDPTPSATNRWVPNPSTGVTVLWSHDNNQVSYDDPDVDTQSGGEWYDIEALYLTLEDYGSEQYLSWALITSYAGVEPANGAAGDPVAYRNGEEGMDLLPEGLRFPYRRHPVLGLGIDAGVDTFNYGIIMAPNHDWQWNGTSADFTNSHGLYDPWTTDPNDAKPDRKPNQTDAVGAEVHMTDTPQLWSVPHENWRDAHPYEFGGGDPHPYNPLAHPVDFDVRDSSGNTNQGVNGAVAATGLYTETGPEQAQFNYWWQQNNWVWEGWVQIPDSINVSTIDSLTAHYAMWCGNNTHQADFTETGFNEEVPEPGTWVLLLATGAFGSWLKRRRED